MLYFIRKQNDMKSELLKLFTVWVILSVIGFLLWIIMLNQTIDIPFFGIGEYTSEQRSIYFYSYRTYFQGPFSVEISGTIGRNFITQTRISGLIILSLLPVFLMTKKDQYIHKILLIAIPLLWTIHPFINFYLWISGN